MLHRQPAPLMVALLAPAGCLALVAWLSWAPTEGGQTAVALLTALGAAAAVSALVFALDASRIRRAFAHLRGGGAALGGTAAPEKDRLREQRQQETVAQLRRQVEQLSAIRDLALIANDDIDLERILERALVVLGGLLDAREIAIYLQEGPERLLVPVAHRLGERIRVRGAKTKAMKVAPREAVRALEARRTIVEANGKAGARAAALLVAEGEIMGALEVRLPRTAHLPGSRDLGRELEGLAKHIALAIRKPTLYDRAVVDSLTKLYTKRHFMEQVNQHMAQRTRLGTPLSLIILDVDHFKRVNDEHGHVAGDLVLAEVARRVKKGIRGYDQAFRYGGEEVVVLLPNTGLEDAAALAERLRQGLRRTPIPTGGEARLRITASFGVAEYRPEAMDGVPAFVEAADQCLYQAKHGGRDQVVSVVEAQALAA